MPRIREHLFISPRLYSLQRGLVQVELTAAGSETARGADRGMLNFSVMGFYDCGWVTLFTAPTRFPVTDLQGEGRRAIHYLMEQLHGPVSRGDMAHLRALGPRLRLMRPGNLISSGGVAADDALVAEERERQRRLSENGGREPEPVPSAAEAEE